MQKFVFNSGLLSVLFLYLVDANASTFLLESEINARATYDDNVDITTNNSESTSFYTLTPKMRLNYFSDSWESAMNASLSGTTYSSKYQDQLDSYLNLETAYKDNRNIYSAAVGYNDVSNRAADENILGQTLEQTDTKTLSLAPKYTRLLTERVSLSLTYTYSDVNYSSLTGQYLPYETQAATGEMIYKLSQKSELSLSLATTDYTSENNISEYQMLASKLGVVHNFSELITGKLSVGTNTRDFTTRSSQNFIFFGSTVTGTQAVETSSTGATFEAAVDAKWIELSASRDTVSNFTGGLDQTDKLHAKLRMQVTPLIGLSLAMDRVTINELNDNVIDYSRSYIAIIPAMNFSLAHNLHLSAQYFYHENDYKSFSQSAAKKNRFAINLKYNFPSI